MATDPGESALDESRHRLKSVGVAGDKPVGVPKPVGEVGYNGKRQGVAPTKAGGNKVLTVGTVR